MPADLDMGVFVWSRGGDHHGVEGAGRSPGSRVPRHGRRSFALLTPPLPGALLSMLSMT